MILGKAKPLASVCMGNRQKSQHGTNQIFLLQTPPHLVINRGFLLATCPRCSRGGPQHPVWPWQVLDDLVDSSIHEGTSGTQVHSAESCREAESSRC